jgi:hypothetical protein
MPASCANKIDAMAGSGSAKPDYGAMRIRRGIFFAVHD